MEKFENVKIMCLNHIFNENAICMSNKLNIEYIVKFEPKPKDFYIVFGGHTKPIELLSKQEELNYSFGYIILNSESQDAEVMKNKYYIDLMKKNIVFNYSSNVADFLLDTYNIKTYSYYFFDFMISKPVVPRRYDYLFIGSKNDNRVKCLDALKMQFPCKNIYIDYEWSHKSAESMKQILSQTEWVINIPYYDNHGNLETHRINNALSCGCQVVSLKSGNEDTDNFYSDYIYFTDDFVSFFKSHEVKEKKSYETLIRGLSSKWNTHNLWIFKKVNETMN